MKISIVTISFNQRKFLKTCIDSVLSQRPLLSDQGIELEYIVVDPGSTDGSKDVINSYGDQLVKIFERDSGPAQGLNNGFKHATGQICGYINADDYFLPGTLVQVTKAIGKSGADILCGHGWIVDENNNKLHRCFSHKFSLEQYALGNCVVMQQSTFFRRESFLRVGGFNNNNSISWDGELMVDMVINGAVVKRLNQFMSCFRVYETSISGSGNYIEKAKEEHLRIKEKIESNLIGEGKEQSLFDYIKYRLFDPWYLFVRCIDALQYGKRRIPAC